jgi:CcmD family protein
VPALDRFGPFVIAAFALTWVSLGAYLLLLRSRLSGLKRALEK